MNAKSGLSEHTIHKPPVKILMCVVGDSNKIEQCKELKE